MSTIVDKVVDGTGEVDPLPIQAIVFVFILHVQYNFFLKCKLCVLQP